MRILVQHQWGNRWRSSLCGSIAWSRVGCSMNFETKLSADINRLDFEKFLGCQWIRTICLCVKFWILEGYDFIQKFFVLRLKWPWWLQRWLNILAALHIVPDAFQRFDVVVFLFEFSDFWFLIPPSRKRYSNFETAQSSDSTLRYLCACLPAAVADNRFSVEMERDGTDGWFDCPSWLILELSTKSTCYYRVIRINIYQALLPVTASYLLPLLSSYQSPSIPIKSFLLLHILSSFFH